MSRDASLLPSSWNRRFRGFVLQFAVLSACCNIGSFVSAFSSVQVVSLNPTTHCHRQAAQIRQSSATRSSIATALTKTKATGTDESENDKKEEFVDMSDVGIVVLAGGKGSRMKANIPKQFLKLNGAPILHYSLQLFLELLPQYLDNIQAGSRPPFVVLVMDPTYQPEYQSIVDAYHGRLVFANPGVERQGSVENGLSKLMEICNGQCAYVAIHDSARPLVTIPEIVHVVQDAKACDSAAVLGVPCKATIKESEDGTTVLRTIPRSRLWEVHTPQVVKIDALLRGFEKVTKENLEVTDDVSIIEQLHEPVRLTLGEYTNLKITTPEDLSVASAILQERQQSTPKLLVMKQQ